MFGFDEKDMCATLAQMAKTAYQRGNCAQSEQKQLMREYLSHDGRFAPYDHNRLIDRTLLCKSNGAVMDLTDPYLFRGGHKRPLD